MEAKEDVTDRSSIKDNRSGEEQNQIAVWPKSQITPRCAYPSSIIGNFIKISALFQHEPQNANHNFLIAFKDTSKVIDDTKVVQLKRAIDNWFSMYYYYHANQKLVNEQYYFNNSWYQPWHPLQISISDHNVLIRLWYLPKNQNFQPYCLSATLNAKNALEGVADHRNVLVSSNDVNKTPLPWRCRSQRRTLDHAFKFFQNVYIYVIDFKTRKS